MMKERPILFSAPMVRALLAGTKTQTRRVVKGLPATAGPFQRFQKFSNDNTIHAGFDSNVRDGAGEMCFHFIRCPYGQPGDRLWVRESGYWALDQKDADLTVYRATADMQGQDVKWMSPLFMPRWASRILLEVTAVRVERLQEISEVDAKAEGIRLVAPAEQVAGEHRDLWEHGKAVTCHPVRAYKHLWTSINGPGSWDANPWVWVVEFRRVDA